jgi:hypothetical protein
MKYTKKFVFEMTDEEKKRMSKWNQSTYSKWRRWITQEYYKIRERFAIKTHGRKCECLDCRVYKNRMRKKFQRPIKRKAK